MRRFQLLLLLAAAIAADLFPLFLGDGQGEGAVVAPHRHHRLARPSPQPFRKREREQLQSTREGDTIIAE